MKIQHYVLEKKNIEYEMYVYIKKTAQQFARDFFNVRIKSILKTIYANTLLDITITLRYLTLRSSCTYLIEFSSSAHFFSVRYAKTHFFYKGLNFVNETHRHI